jgi:alkylresorcinol/alkylpyrone synthase
VPSFAEDNIQSAISGILHRAGIGMNDVDRFVCHPGGTKVIVA